jgi:hypothetical protein
MYLNWFTASRGHNAAPNREQDEYWNREEAIHWVAHVDRYDVMFGPFDGNLFERADITRTATLSCMGNFDI